MGFHVGDRVTLTGKMWERTGYGVGGVVTIQEVASETYNFVGNDEEWWELDEPGWEVELNTDTPAEHFAKTAAKFANDPISTEDAEKLKTLGEQLGISPRTLTNGDTETTQTFAMNVNRITNKIANLLIEKNQSYGDSALNPVRIFSKADRMEQLFVRLDDKLSRVQRGHEYPGDDTIRDIIGYCTLVLIAREGE